MEQTFPLCLIHHVFFSLLTPIFMHICIQRNQADFKYMLPNRIFAFSVYYSEIQMNRRQKLEFVWMHIIFLDSFYDSKLLLLFGLEVKWKWLLAMRRRRKNYKSSAYDIHCRRTVTFYSQLILWNFVFAVGQNY